MFLVKLTQRLGSFTRSVPHISFLPRQYGIIHGTLMDVALPRLHTCTGYFSLFGQMGHQLLPSGIREEKEKIQMSYQQIRSVILEECSMPSRQPDLTLHVHNII